jgi:hypothetical protein
VFVFVGSGFSSAIGGRRSRSTASRQAQGRKPQAFVFVGSGFSRI